MISIYDPKKSSFTYRMYFLGFIAGVLLLSSLFGHLRRYLAKGLSKEVQGRVKSLTMDLFIFCIFLSILKMLCFFGAFSFMGGMIKVQDIDL